MATRATLNEIISIVYSKDTNENKIARLRATGYTKKEAEETLILMMRASGRYHTARKPFTIGVEMECYNVDKTAMVAKLALMGINAIATGYNHDDQASTYKLGSDSSIDGDNSCEVVSPILHNLNSLKKVCTALNEAGTRVNRSCGCHVHFGAERFTNAQWRRIVLNYAHIERIIDSFMPESRRRDNNTYCKSLYGKSAMIAANDNWGYEDIARHLHSRYYKVNLEAYRSHKTIEFRQHSGTTDFNKIAKWVKFLESFLYYSMEHTELIEARSIDELPFLEAEEKAYFKSRAESLA